MHFIVSEGQYKWLRPTYPVLFIIYVMGAFVVWQSKKEENLCAFAQEQKHTKGVSYILFASCVACTCSVLWLASVRNISLLLLAV